MRNICLKKKYIITFILFLTGCYPLIAQEWPAIQPEARPATRWWWMGSAVDASNLTYNLEEYAKAGLGGVEITPIYGVQGNDDKNLSFLSPEWMKMLQHTQNEGKRLGIEIDMNTGTGWPFGGPEVSIEDAATKAIFQSYQIEGGTFVNLDISIKDKWQKPVAYLSRIMAYSDNRPCLNLTAQARDGKLQWQAPEGKWEIIVLYVGKTFQKVKRAAPGGEGYVMNHLDKDAVKRYFSKFDKAFAENRMTYPHTFFNDSYEVYGADWTADFLEQFAKRRGYKLENYFREFLDKNRPDITARIVSDYRETISELVIENFSRQWTAWAHSHGSITRNQAHGSPANLIDTYASVDIPECEGFGLSQFYIKGLRQDSLTRTNDSDLSMLKYASSAAHIAGKPLTSSETFTWLTDHFRTSLSQCKPDMDLMFLSGVNHMFFHGTPYSPREAKWPGWKFYASVDMSPTNSIWRDASAFFEYITRCQSFLQMGEPDNDFLLYLPLYDIWQEQPGRLLLFTIHHMAKRAPKFIETVHTIMQNGYDVDYISDTFIQSTRCQNGKLITKGGASYKALIIPGAKLMPERVLKHLLKLAGEGATIIFMENYPEDVPGYNRLEKRRKDFAELRKQLPAIPSFDETLSTSYRKGTIITGKDYESTLAKSHVHPEEMKVHHGLQYIRRSNDGGYHYFISSLQDKGVDDWVTLSVPARDVMLFNPLTGEKGKAQTRIQNNQIQVRLQLHSGESIILQTFNRILDKAGNWDYIREQPVSLSLDYGWKLHFIESAPVIEGEFPIDTPSSWTEINHPNAAITMATGVYTNEVNIPQLSADDWILDLGDVRESARVRINGQEAGVAWAAPFRLKVGKWLKPGRNRIEIEVTNLPANRISDMDRQGENWRIFNDINMVALNYSNKLYDGWQPLPSGLNGIVRLVPVDYQ